MLEIKKCEQNAPKTQYEPNPKFGTIFTPYLLKMKVKLGQSANFQAEITPYETQSYWPGTSGLHYGQSIFEGMKAYMQPDGSAGIFQLDMHANRFKKSAARMCMAELPPEIFSECLKSYVEHSKDHIPAEEGHSLYLRPLLIANDPQIKVGASQEYIFYIMSTIAGRYFGTEPKPKPVKVMVNKHFVRAFPGGTGEAKTCGNYAASIWPQFYAAKFDCPQVLYLDAVNHRYVEEMGGMNFFIIKGKDLITPKLNGCILNGVTRRTILEIAAQHGLNPKEENIDAQELFNDIESGSVPECFACGTAAIVSPVGELFYQENLEDKGRGFKLKGDFKKTFEILKSLTDIHTGKSKLSSKYMTQV